jgi:hypothetical protein
MFLLSASTALLLLAAPSAPGNSASPNLRLHEGLPAGFKVDGKLDEWKLPVSITFGADHQVVGKSKVSSPRDLSARVWVALGAEGLAVAGEVQDDSVHLSTQADHIHHDHVEVWLALPQPTMPPLAFVNQFGEHEVPTAAACEGNEDIVDGDPAKCRAWWREQAERRKQLVRPFTVQYGLMSGSVIRFGPKDTVGSIRYEPMPGGYRFEALIPPSAFPRSAEAPLRTLKVLVDLVDNDEGKGKLETFLSSAKGRKFGDPSTFHSVTLAQPLRFGAWPELLERILKANEHISSYQPAPDAQVIDVWVNPAVGYQYQPEEPSPKVVSLDLSRQDPQGKLGEVELLLVPGEVGFRGYAEEWMISRRARTLLDARRSGTRELRVAPRGKELHIVLVHENTLSALGTGACGACPMMSFQLVKMDAQGRLVEVESLEGAYSQGEELEWEVKPDLSRLEVFMKPGEGTSRHLLVRYSWDPKAGRYQEEKFEPPVPKEEY